MISMICAVGKNREIGFKNRLLWNLPKDLKHFKDITNGHTVVMGQKTFESIGKALPDRKNIVLSLDPNFNAENCEISDNLEGIAKAYKDSEEEIFIMGGASIYKQFIKYASKLYLTLVDDSPEADVFFPDYSDFKNITSESPEQEENGIKYKFVELGR
ncbi:MAG: dihydrofolate reductase [Candidatus Pacebacteria bacterium]|nr:dihydrofolate reductase [Candidatus Paceibacterota bacterium]